MARVTIRSDGERQLVATFGRRKCLSENDTHCLARKYFATKLEMGKY